MRQRKPDKDLSEKELDVLLFGTPGKPGPIRQVGYLCYHTYRPQRSVAGYPDWSCLRERHVYIELKTEKGVTTDEQKRWIRAILKVGTECYVVRPRNIAAITTVMAARRRASAIRLTEGWTTTQTEARAELIGEIRDELGLDDDDTLAVARLEPISG